MVDGFADLPFGDGPFGIAPVEYTTSASVIVTTMTTADASADHAVSVHAVCEGAGNVADATVAAIATLIAAMDGTTGIASTAVTSIVDMAVRGISGHMLVSVNADETIAIQPRAGIDMLVSVNADETITIPPTAGIDGAIDAGYGATILPTRTIWDDVYRPDTTEASGFVMRFRIAEATPLLTGVAPVASIESVADENGHYEVTLITGVTYRVEEVSAFRRVGTTTLYPPGTIYTITVPAGSTPVSMPDVRTYEHATSGFGYGPSGGEG